MQTPTVLQYFCSAILFALPLVSAQQPDYSLKNPAADDPRIQKQHPFHWGTPPPNHRVKLEFVPIKVLASVRHEKSTKFVPRREALSEATTPEEIILAKRLKEAITTKKLGEVYTEQGYEDQNYDHGHYEKQGEFKEKFLNHDKKEHRALQGDKSDDSAGDQATHATVKIGAATEAPVDLKKYPFYLTAPNNSPKRYATNPKLLPDKKNNPDLPFYESTNYKECPDISPVLSVGPDDKGPKGEPRLRGLGDKIDCLVSKYFGSDPFDNPLFKEDKVHAANINPKYLLPSETNNGPVLFITNATYKEQAESETRMKKMRESMQQKKGQTKRTKTNNPQKTPRHPNPVAMPTEQIEGMLPPPLPLKLRKTRDISTPLIYSTRQGGVKFLVETPGEKIPDTLPSRRIPHNSKYGARAISGRSYEVTEEPEEQQSVEYPLAAKVPAKTVKIERHRLNQEEHALYSSTYVPETGVPNAGPEDTITTTKWNAVPYAPREPENVELSSSISDVDVSTTTARPPKSSRGRARVHAAIPEDIFEGRGERRIRPVAATGQPEVQRTRQRIRAPKRVQTVAVDQQITTINKYALAEPTAEVATEAPATQQVDVPLINPIPASEQTTEFVPPERPKLDVSGAKSNEDLLTAEPIGSVPETTMNSLASEDPVSATTTIATTSARTRQRSGGRSRDRNSVDSTPKTARPQARGRKLVTPSMAEVADPLAGEKSTARRTNRRGKQRTKADDIDKSSSATRNAPESGESAMASPALNQRSRATSPAVAVTSDRQQQQASPRARPALWSKLWEWTRNKIQVTVNISNNKLEWYGGHYCFFFFCTAERSDVKMRQRIEQEDKGQKMKDAVERDDQKKDADGSRREEAVPSAAPVALSYYPEATPDQYYAPNAVLPTLQWVFPHPS